jgi:hypothetical protein
VALPRFRDRPLCGRDASYAYLAPPRRPPARGSFRNTGPDDSLGSSLASAR